MMFVSTVVLVVRLKPSKKGSVLPLQLTEYLSKSIRNDAKVLSLCFLFVQQCLSFKPFTPEP